jgi:hypothetical protein
MTASARYGAYGLALKGVDEAAELLLPAPDSWHSVEIVRLIGAPTANGAIYAPDHAELELQTGGRIEIEREPTVVTFTTPRKLDADALVHPFLAPAAAVVNHWLGREAFHAGAFSVAGATWGLIGPRGSGKSSTLAALALRGVPIICDDVLVLEGPKPLPGPRTIDLREEAAVALEAGAPLGVAGARERWRLRVAQLDAVPPLAGWIHLEWAVETSVERVAGAEKLRRLASERVLDISAAAPESFLEVAALPAWSFRRPREWTSAAGAIERLLTVIAA